jgi:hypothetical protein
MKNSIRVGDKVMGIMGVSGGYAGTVIAIKRDGRHNVVFYKDDDGAVYETLDSNITKNVPEKGKFPRKNPARRSDESPLYVKYLSLKSDEDPFMMQGSKYEYVWAEYPGGIKDIGVYSYANDLVYSYDSFRQMMNLDRANPVKPRKGEKTKAFVSRCMSEEKVRFPEPKQRIAVCLSKSRQRNPVYDTGSDE